MNMLENMPNFNEFLKSRWHNLQHRLSTLEPWRCRARESHRVLLTIVFLTNMADNLLLTAVVPIIPTFLLSLDKQEFDNNKLNVTANTTMTALYYPGQAMENATNTLQVNMTNDQGFSISAVALSENGRVGWLLSSKAIVQLFANPFVGPLCNRVGYPLLLLIGTIVIFTSSIVFAVAESYIPLFVARSLQGLGSATAVIAGMSIVAQSYPDDRGRSRAMGIAMGGAAFGVLLGYPFGGFMYTFVGKTAAFLIIGGVILLDLGVQYFVFGIQVRRESYGEITPLHVLLQDRYILIASGAIMLTTMSMSVLEPTVPLWVMGFMNVKNWELGLIFLPDSVGYFVGTNCFGVVARNIGRSMCTFSCMLLIALCQICLPFATDVPQLILPHFGLGLGLGITDAAIMPLLALLVDVRHEPFYGCVYAIAQLAVCLAYSIGPLVAGQVVKAVGFSWLMRGLAILNLAFCPLCYILSTAPTTCGEDMPLQKRPACSQYIDNSEEVDQSSISYGRLCEDDD